MERSLRPLLVCAVLAVAVLTLAYVGGYFALSFPYSGPSERIFGTSWQYSLYTPLVELESGIRGDGFRCGYVW